MPPKQTERGIALLRIIFGFWMFRSAMTHLVWTPWPWVSMGWMQSMTPQLAQYSLDHPSLWVRAFLQQSILPNAESFLGITLILQLIAGISLTFGLMTVLGGILTLLMALLSGILTYHQGDVVLGYSIFQGAGGLVFFVTRSGRRWGFDTFLAGIKSESIFW